MNLYAHDLSLLDFNYGFSDCVSEPFSHRLLSSGPLYHDEDDDDYRPIINYGDLSRYDRDHDRRELNKESQADGGSYPKHRHDGKSPLPLGMDWSAPPRNWDGKQTIWPHDPQTGWSYCVTVPSWVRVSKTRGSDPVVFYRVQVGIQSPEAITGIRVILRRFSDFLELHSALKKEFPKKNFPEAPPKKMLRMKSRTLLEERRCFLDDWMGKLLSDIEISRSVPVATFLELEAAVRSYFSDVDQEISDGNPFLDYQTPSFDRHANSNASLFLDSSSITSDHANGSHDDVSEIRTFSNEKNNDGNLVTKNAAYEQNLAYSQQSMLTGLEGSITCGDKLTENTSTSKHQDGEDCLHGVEYQRLDGSVGTFPIQSMGSESSLLQARATLDFEASNVLDDNSMDHLDHSDAFRTVDDIQFQRNLVVAFHSDERQRLYRVLNTLQQRLATTKADIEDLIARLNQETAVRQFLTTKVKDLEAELETTRDHCKDNMEQAVLSEKEKFTQMQWDIEELRKQCMEMEVALASLRDENAGLESAKASLSEENEMLTKESDLLREKLENLHKHHEETEVKLKADIKVLAKEVKSLRTSQSELKQELGQLMREKIEMEKILQREKQRAEKATTANENLLHECDILRNRLQECSINFLIEEDGKLVINTSSASDSLELLATSDNRIGLLLAEAQLLAQEVDKLSPASEENLDKAHRPDDDLRKMLTDTLIDNARLRKLVNSVFRCALAELVNSDTEDEEQDEKEKEEEEIPLRQTVLSRFLER